MENDHKPFRQMILPLSLLTAIFFFNFIARIVPAPLMPTIMEDINLTNDQAGSFFLVIASGYFFSIICSGFVSSRLKHKKTLLVSAVGTGICFATAGFAQSYAGILASLLAVGITTGLYMPSGMAILTASIDNRHWGKAIGIHEMAPNVSFLVAPLLCEAFLLWWSWRSVFIVMGFLSIIAGLLFYKFSTAIDFEGEAPTLSALLPLAATPSFWMMMTLFTVGVIGTMGIYSMLPLYLVKIHGMVQAQANTLVSLSRILTIPVALTAGWLTDRIGVKRALTGQLLFTGLLTLLIGCSSGRMLQAVIICQPILAVCFFPPGFAALSRIGSPKTRNITISFIMPVAILIGGGFIPKIMGIMGNADYFSQSFMLCGALIFFCAGIPLALKLSGK